ncbi:MAG: histidinol dehydrogenase [Pseudomonadales bacterium]|jgi:histidinol dehydrogenase|nr:histidinol dehydrogenase [Gammaproteobacteria bacterium]MBP6481684.1 histidinol dehydrogenase [Pseudomonadales bacterium]MBP7908869.1 histidinol dehydrogenase [Pseudomonadales bacterium]
MMRRLDASAPGFAGELAELLDFSAQRDAGVVEQVAAIIADVRARGDAALLEYTNRFDARALAEATGLEIAPAALAQASARIPSQLREALQAVASRIESYHLRQRQESWQYRDADGTLLGQRITALDRAGLYVPGGKASYPSSVLMNAIPARVAGVGELVMVVPAPRGELSDAVLAAAHIAGVDRVFTIGGAQAVAALAFGTATVPRADKIVGPGNVYVAEAKRQVFGEVGIDMIAGPSEIAVICDGATDPEWIALDLFSQAEHDEHAQSILISPDSAFLDAVANCIARLLPAMARADIIGRSLAARGAFILVRDLAEAAEISNRIAPEHLELSVAEPEQLLAAIRHAGAVFLGRHTPEAIGDYCAGPSHVLPTAGTARFASPLGVHDFQKRSSLIGCSPAGADRLGRLARVLAESESLQAHALSAAARVLKSGEGA